MSEVFFTDRAEAGRMLAQRLERFRDAAPVVLALPRGGLPVGYEIARALEAPLDVIFVRKIGAPSNSELAIGAVVDGGEPELVLNESIIRELEVPREYIEREKAMQLAEIERRQRVYRAGHPPVDVTGRTVIVVDDGIATGSTLRAALRALRRRHPKRLVAAVPVAAAESVESLKAEADEIVCLHAMASFYAVGVHYREFPQLTDAEVIAILDKSRRGQLDFEAARQYHK